MFGRNKESHKVAHGCCLIPPETKPSLKLESMMTEKEIGQKVSEIKYWAQRIEDSIKANQILDDFLKEDGRPCIPSVEIARLRSEVKGLRKDVSSLLPNRSCATPGHKTIPAPSHGCYEKPISDVERRVNPFNSVARDIKTATRDIKIDLGIDAADAVKAVNDLKKAMHDCDSSETDVTDLQVDKITTGTIKADQVNVTGVKPAALKIVINDVNGQPTAYLDGKQVAANSIKLDYEAANDRVSQMFWKVEYYDQERKSICTKSESNETRRDRMHHGQS